MNTNNGFSLVELIIALAITAILTVIAVPSLITYVQKSRLTGAGQRLYYAIQTARSEAVKRNTNVYVSIVVGTNWCYGVNTGASCNCSTANSCNLGTTSAANTSLSLAITGFSSSSVRFEPIHGAANASGKATFTTADGLNNITVKVGLLGNPILCSSTLTGYQACS